MSLGYSLTRTALYPSTSSRSIQCTLAPKLWGTHVVSQVRYEASVPFLQDFDSNPNTPCKRSDNNIQPSNYRSILRQVPSSWISCYPAPTPRRMFSIWTSAGVQIAMLRSITLPVSRTQTRRRLIALRTRICCEFVRVYCRNIVKPC
jgi:hypothetical protein